MIDRLSLWLLNLSAPPAVVDDSVPLVLIVVRGAADRIWLRVVCGGRMPTAD